jgi:two-component system, LytTR family, sensor kinase
MKRLRAWLWISAGWATLALFFAVSNSLTYRSTGRPANWTLSLKRSASDWILWAALTPVVAWLARRCPLHGQRLALNGLVHLASGLVVAVAKTAGDRILFALLSGFWTYWLISTLAFNFTIYCCVVAAAHGVEYYRRGREREHFEQRLTETRLQLLGMQLQPHFLFNTLNTIAEMVHEDPEKADTMIAGLSDLLRRTLDLGTAQDITLEGELDLVNRYLDLQKARFGDRLRVTFAVQRRQWRHEFPRCCCSHWWRMRFGTGSRLASMPDQSISMRGKSARPSW